MFSLTSLYVLLQSDLRQYEVNNIGMTSLSLLAFGEKIGQIKDLYESVCHQKNKQNAFCFKPAKFGHFQILYGNLEAEDDKQNS